MDFRLVLNQMTAADKLRLLEEIWDDLCRDPKDVPSPEWHRETLRGREARVQSGKSEFTDWSQAKKEIRDATEERHR